jgi:hypothetical protein
MSDKVSTFQDSIQSRRRSLAPDWQQPIEQLQVVYGEIPHSSGFSTSVFAGSQYVHVDEPQRFSNAQPFDQDPTEYEYIHRPSQQNDQISSFQDTIRMYPSRFSADRAASRTTQVFHSEPRYTHQPDYHLSTQAFPTNSAYQTSGYPTHPTYSGQSQSIGSYTTVVQPRPAYETSHRVSGVLGGRVLLSYAPGPAHIAPPATATVYRVAAGVTYEGDSDPSGSVVCC